MPKKLDILKLFSHEEPLTPSHLANLLDIKQNYARQIILRLKRQGLIFLYPSFADGQTYSLTTKGEERIVYLADKEKKETKKKERKAVEERKESGMYLHEVVAEALPKEIEKRIRNEFDITSMERLGSKRLNEIELPQKIREEAGFSKLSGERMLAHHQLPFDVWIRVLENMSKPTPKPQHLSVEELLIITALTEKKKGEFLVTEDGEVFYAPEGYLTMEAAALVATNRRERKRKGWT